MDEFGRPRTHTGFWFTRTDVQGMPQGPRNKPYTTHLFLSAAEAKEFCDLLDCYMRSAYGHGFRQWPEGRKAVVLYVTGAYLQYPYSYKTIKDALLPLGVWWENWGVDVGFRGPQMWFSTSSGQKRLANNNAGNLLNYPDYCLPMVREWLDSLRSMKIKNVVPWQSKQSFIYIVADHYTHNQKTMPEPVLLLLAHRQDKSNRVLWGIPGGMQEFEDVQLCPLDAFVACAKRKFAEEFLSLEKSVPGYPSGYPGGLLQAQKDAVRQLFSNASKPIKSLFVSRDGTMAGFRVCFADSFTLEKMARRFNERIDPHDSRTNQRTTRISKEMNGYAWVAKSAIDTAIATNRLDRDGNLLVCDMGGAMLPVRPYTLGRMQGQWWVPNRTLSRVFS